MRGVDFLSRPGRLGRRSPEAALSGFNRSKLIKLFRAWADSRGTGLSQASKPGKAGVIKEKGFPLVLGTPGFWGLG